MRSLAAILFVYFLTATLLFAQGEINDQEKIFFRNERTFAVTISTNGYGLNYRYAKRLDARRKTLYELGIGQIKHEKEYKISDYNSQSLGGSYVYGKLNSLFYVRLGIGFQKELYRKEDRGGISIRYFYNFGPSLGLQKPVYYDVQVYDFDQNGQPIYVRKRMKYEEHIYTIERKAPFYVGFSELTLVPGVYGKLGFTFEFSKADEVFNAIEVGIIADAYIKKIPIMDNSHNHFIFPGAYVSYRFGKIIDSQFTGRGRGKVDELLSDD